LASQGGVRGIESRGDRSGLDSEHLADRGVLEIGVVPQKDSRSLAFRQPRERDP
jgi:hypothetical protein